MEVGRGQPFDDRAELHKATGDVLASIARRHYKIDIDDTTLERWRQLGGLVREVDTWADDTDVSREEVVKELETFELFAERYPRLAPGELEDDARAAIIRRADRIFEVGERAAGERSVRRFLAFRLIEARETVNMLEDIATDYVTEQPGFRTECMPGLQALGKAATMWDSLIDAKQDVKAGKQVLQPNKEYYASLAGAIMRYGKLGGKALLHFEPNELLVRKGVQRIKNRIEHGIQPYSSLHRFTKKV